MGWLQDRLGIPSGDSGSFGGYVAAPFAAPINYVANMAGAGSQDPGADFFRELGTWFNPIGQHNQTQFPQQRPAVINQNFQSPDMSKLSPYDATYRPDASGTDVNNKWLSTQYGTWGYNEKGHPGNQYWSVSEMDPSKLPTSIDNLNFSQARDIYKDYFQNLSNYYSGGGMFDNISKSDLGSNNNYKNFLPEYDQSVAMAQSAYMDLLSKFRNRGDFGADLIGKGGFGNNFGPSFGSVNGRYDANPYYGGSMASSYNPNAANDETIQKAVQSRGTY